MRKNLLLQPFFIVVFLLYITVLSARVSGVTLPEIINSYLTDILCMPMILSLSGLLVRRIKKDASINLTVIQILGMTLFYAWYFEWFLPQTSARYTADRIDVLCYFLGSFIFWFAIQPKLLQPNYGQKK